MSDFFLQLFGWLCARPPERTWLLAGEHLPFCQRCTGFYVGVLAAALLYAGCRVPPSPRYWVICGLSMLQIVLFAFKLVPDIAWLRTVSGALYAYSVVGFLWSLPSGRLGVVAGARPPRHWHHGVVGGICLGALLAVVSRGHAAAGQALAWLGFIGLLALAVLILANAGICLVSLWGWRKRSEMWLR